MRKNMVSTKKNLPDGRLKWNDYIRSEHKGKFDEGIGFTTSRNRVFVVKNAVSFFLTSITQSSTPFQNFF